jgi:hypothetical protein
MTRWLLALAFAGALAACGGGGGSTPSATLATTPTTARTTTTQSVEAQVEAAYLKSWDVYADAVRTFDTSKLATVYTDKALTLRLDEVARLRADDTPARTVVTHRITKIDLLKPGEAVVHDDYENHSVLLDGKTGAPIEKDPNAVVSRQYAMRNVEGVWKVWLVVAP